MNGGHNESVAAASEQCVGVMIVDSDNLLATVRRENGYDTYS